ncbi:hypothetical protein F2P81_006310 [Scophthalmus maximus]|uniref:Uncharacterized protein n=1 Tax=Scophthalmus maximus TaxID=52904 RepID=A0A6A4TDT2_SCOMX|nr:hypothetical protein F2P81_006310 [Scophthalmus maximus]
MAAPVGRDSLPEHWSYGVCADGRVFFVECRVTDQCLSPGVVSDVPRGWEEGFTDQGASYFIKCRSRCCVCFSETAGKLKITSCKCQPKDSIHIQRCLHWLCVVLNDVPSSRPQPFVANETGWLTFLIGTDQRCLLEACSRIAESVLFRRLLILRAPPTLLLRQRKYPPKGRCYPERLGVIVHHNQGTTAFRHPVTGQISPENVDFILQEHPTHYIPLSFPSVSYISPSETRRDQKVIVGICIMALEDQFSSHVDFHQSRFQEEVPGEQNIVFTRFVFEPSLGISSPECLCILMMGLMCNSERSEHGDLNDLRSKPGKSPPVSAVEAVELCLLMHLKAFMLHLCSDLVPLNYYLATKHMLLST